MDNNTEIIVSQDEALTAFNQLWSMLQDEEGVPLSVEANEHLLTVYNAMRHQVAIDQWQVKQIGALTDLAADLRMQRDLALNGLEEARQAGARIALRSIEINFKYDFGLDPDAAKALIDALIEGNVPDGMPYYIFNGLRKAFEAFETEFNEMRELDADPGQDESDDDGDDLS